MAFSKLLVTLAGLCGIGFVYWFFLLKKETTVIATGAIDITVEGGYSPAVISVPRGKTTRINFFRKDPSSCLEEVVLPNFSARGGSASGGKIRKYLPLNQKTAIEITPQQPGEYNFSCGMNMFHGKIIVQ